MLYIDELKSDPSIAEAIAFIFERVEWRLQDELLEIEAQLAQCRRDLSASDLEFPA